MRHTIFFFCYVLLSLSLHSQRLSILDKVNTVIDDSLIITDYNLPNSSWGVYLIEESHDKQVNNARAIQRLHSFYKINKIVLEGLYHDDIPKRDYRLRDIDFESDEFKIYRNLAFGYLETRYYENKERSIQNAEYIYLTNPNIELIKSEREKRLEFQAPEVDSLIHKSLFEILESDSILFEKFLDYISFKSIESSIEQLLVINTYLDQIDTGSEAIKRSKSYFQQSLKFTRYAAKRSRNVATSINRNLLKEKESIIAVIGAGHSYWITNQLRKKQIPFVVICDRSSLKDETKKPEPYIHTDNFKKTFFTDYVFEIFKHNSKTNQSFPSSLTKKILNKAGFEIVDYSTVDQTFNVILRYKGKNIEIARKIPDIKISKTSVIDNKLQLTHRINRTKNFVEYTADNFNNSLFNSLQVYLNSEEYRKQRSFFKYNYRDNSYSIETDWTDKILYSKLNRDLNNQLIIQYAGAYGKRPDWFFRANNGNWACEVKYLRNKSSFRYIERLLINNQLEKYIKDESLNLRTLTLLILVDFDGAINYGISKEEISSLKDLLEKHIEKIRQDQNIQLELRLLEVRVFEENKSVGKV